MGAKSRHINGTDLEVGVKGGGMSGAKEKSIHPQMKYNSNNQFKLKIEVMDLESSF